MQARASCRSLVVAFGATVAAASSAPAAECAGVTFVDAAKAGPSDVVLNGLGLRTATFLRVKVYVASLYLPQKTGDAAQILGADRPWRIEMRYLHDVGAKDIREGFDEGLKIAAGPGFEALRPRVEQLNAQIKDVKSGEYLAFTHYPAKGVAVDVNGAGGSTIAGGDFATALLANWVGPKTPNQTLRAGMLGGPCD